MLGLISGKWTLRLGLVAGALAAAVMIYGTGYDDGRDAAEVRAAEERMRLEQKLAARTAALKTATARLDAARAARAEKTERLENEANEADDADRRALSPDSVRRLKDRWSRD